MRWLRSTLPFSLGVAGLMYTWSMPRSSTCQWKAAWNSEPLSVRVRSTWQRQLLEHVVDELDRALLTETVVDAQHAQPRAVVDRGALVVGLACAPKRGDELRVDLDLVTGLGLLVALPALAVTPVALGGRQTAQAQSPEDPPDPRLAQGQGVVAPQVHRDLQGAEVVRLAQVDDLPDDLLTRRPRAAVVARGAVAQPGVTELRVAPLPLVEALPGDG